MLTRDDSVPDARARLIEYFNRRVSDPRFCVHEFSARCKRGIEWREQSRRAPIPRHRALTITNDAGSAGEGT